MSMVPEATDTTAFSLVTVHRHFIITSASRVRNMIGTSTNAAAVPGVYNIKNKGSIYPNGGVKGRRWLPRPVTYAANIFAFSGGFLQGYTVTIAKQHIATVS